MGQAQPILKARAFLGFSGLQTEAQSPRSPRFIDHNRPFGEKKRKKPSKGLDRSFFLWKAFNQDTTRSKQIVLLLLNMSLELETLALVTTI